MAYSVCTCVLEPDTGCDGNPYNLNKRMCLSLDRGSKEIDTYYNYYYKRLARDWAGAIFVVLIGLSAAADLFCCCRNCPLKP